MDQLHSRNASDDIDDHISSTSLDNNNINHTNLKKIFIGNLPFSITKHELEDLFCSYGIIIGVNIREDRIIGKSKGFAFITYEHEESALEAIKYVHHLSYQGRELTVNLAISRGQHNNVNTNIIDNKDQSWKTVPLPSPLERIKEKKKNYSINNKNNTSNNKKNIVKALNTWDQWAGPIKPCTK